MIKLIVVGKLKEKYLVDATNEYLKRLSKYTKVEIIEIPDEEINSLVKEKDKISKHIKDTDYVITLEISGNNLSSEEFAHKIDKLFISSSNLIFIIGGSYGLHDDIKARSNYALSFSSLTFPHQLFRVMLLEQIYRCYKIINHEAYHK